ncbi:MAG: MFS transporter [Anaerolineales bacterium]
MVANPTPFQRTIFRNLYWDVFWFGILQGSAIAFLAIYAARIGASALQVGLLTSGPAVVNLLASLPAGRWLQGKPTTQVAFVSSVWHRLGYFVFVALPWFLPESAQAWAMPIIIVLMAIPGTLLAIVFNAMFADVVPPEYRASVVGRRNALLAVASTVVSLLCGQLLDRVPYPLNYQIVFALGALGAGLSSYYLGRIRPPDELPPRINQLLNDDARPGGMLRFGDAMRSAVGLRFLTRSGARELLRINLLRGPFGPLLFAYFAFYMFQYAAIPLQPLWWVNALKLSDGVISAGHAIFWGTLLLASTQLGPLSARLGHHRVMILGALFYGLYPLLNALAVDATLFFVASFIGGAVWGIANGGLVNRLMERVPEDDRPAHMALHNLALNVGILSGSLLGPALAEWLGLRDAMIISAGLRVVGALLLWRWA